MTNHSSATVYGKGDQQILSVTVDAPDLRWCDVDATYGGSVGVSMTLTPSGARALWGKLGDALQHLDKEEGDDG